MLESRPVKFPEVIWFGRREWSSGFRSAKFLNLAAQLRKPGQVSPLRNIVTDDPASPYAPPAANPVAPVVGGGVQLAPPTSGLAIASMVCGILSLFFCFCGGMLLGIPAVICGHMALKQTGSERPGMPPRMGGRGMAIAGLVMGYIGILLIIVGIIANVAGVEMAQ